MSVTNWLVSRRENAAADWRYEAKCARLLEGTPLSTHASNGARKARRKLRFWDALLDLATHRERANPSREGNTNG